MVVDKSVVAGLEATGLKASALLSGVKTSKSSGAIPDVGSLTVAGALAVDSLFEILSKAMTMPRA